MTESSSTPAMLNVAEQRLMYVVTRPEQVMVRGKGSYLWDANDNRYLDFIQGWAVNCLGHCPPVLVRAINKQTKQLVNGSPALLNDQMIEAANILPAVDAPHFLSLSIFSFFLLTHRKGNRRICLCFRPTVLSLGVTPKVSRF